MTERPPSNAVDTSDPALPVVGSGTLSGVRRSTRGRWRAAVLIGLHLLILLHITHFLLAGRTISPVEPSEAMYTLELGQLNAGFVFLVLALLSTLIVGRFFCGWGCHLVALQDFCGWLMKKFGIRPRPFRSRWLLYLPLGLALYMFVWPTLLRLSTSVFGQPARSFPGFSNHLVTTGFWNTFPGLVFSVLTFAVCGFAAVYILGAKGFCTYGCPYGAFFAIADRLSPLRVRVTDACEQCGHCTVTCTSNVRVHDEVRRFGMVTDPGCMKTTDCISVCPNDALYLGLGRPAVFKPTPAKTKRRRRSLTGILEEAMLLAVGIIAMFTFRGLYDGPSLLLAAGLAGITAFAFQRMWRMIRRVPVRLQNHELVRQRAWTRTGWCFAVGAVLWLGFTAHSSIVQWERYRGRVQLDHTEASRPDVIGGSFNQRTYSIAHIDALYAAHRHFTRANRWGLVDVLEVKLGLVWTHLLRNEVDEASRLLATAITLAPERDDLVRDLAQMLLARGRTDEAIEVLERRADSPFGDAEDHFNLAGLLAALGHNDQAIQRFRSCLELDPDSHQARYNLGGLLRRTGHPQQAVEELSLAAAASPGDRDTLVELALSYRALGNPAEALRYIELAIAFDPAHPESAHFASIAEQLRQELGR